MTAFFVLAQTPPAISRDSYGVAYVRESVGKSVWHNAGYAVAQDRMWQMENSRRVSRGKMAEVFGPKFLASDKEIALTCYTDDELQSQLAKLPSTLQKRFVDYAAGVNEYLAEAKKAGTLPAGYAEAGFEPTPWTVSDSVAVCIRLLQQFGKGGAGEIRNMALLSYLKTQPKLKGKELDVLDDLAWFQDADATTTVSDLDDPHRGKHYIFNLPSRAQTVQHIAALPNLTLFDLLPGIRLAERTESTKVAELRSVPYKVGSYCVVVAPQKSITGEPLLLSAPQMGWQTPSIVHEMTVVQPEGSVTGMDLPGVPGILIGHSGERAWGLTSGVADCEDIVFFPSNDGKNYKSYEGVKPIENVEFKIAVKGGETVTVQQRRTIDGPVVLGARGTLFARKSAFRGRELESYESVAAVPFENPATSPATKKATMSFNFFWADKSGSIGYRYMGLVPDRTPGLDPRFPIPGEKVKPWKGYMPFEQMPYVNNPKSGLLANWNNKPVAWWANGDTPVWGKVFRNSELLAGLQGEKISTSQVENAAWAIARRDFFWRFLSPVIDKIDPAVGKTLGFDGWNLEDSTAGARGYWFVRRLREKLFSDAVGTLISPDNFAQALQPSLMLRALEGKTKYDFLAGRSAKSVLAETMKVVAEDVKARPTLSSGGVVFGNLPRTPYMDRGTFMQIVEFREGKPQGRSLNMPGVAESGPHSLDQVLLGRAWVYKPMKL